MTCQTSMPRFDLGEFAASSRLLCAITTRGGRVLWANDALGRAFGPRARP